MTPQYELRMIVESTSVWRLEIWQATSPATPRLKAPEHVATIQGPGLRIAAPEEYRARWACLGR